MPAIGHSPAAQAAGEEDLRRTRQHLSYIPCSPRAKRMIARIVTHAAYQRAYAQSGGTGLHSYHATMLRQCRSLREAKRALMKYAVRELGGEPKLAAEYARMLAQPFAALFEGPGIQAERWVRRLELKALRTYAAECRRAS